MMKQLLLALFVLSSGCASMDKALTGGVNAMPDEEARKELVKKFPELTSEQQQKFLKGDVWVGMSQAHLDAHMGGTPEKSQKKLTSAGSQNIELYRARVGNWKTGTTTKYFRAILTEGKLTEFQEFDGDIGSFDKI